ncbi:MAG: peptidoglycan DD-metalloendopeptidase family protein [Thermoleophilaceae bacterium]|nr:peptidoglycan DD-metalloendopeptidase family protein [Thermoleophilaceae bacterium]
MTSVSWKTPTKTRVAAVVAATAAVCMVAVGTAGAQERRLPRTGVDRYTPIVQKVHSTPRWFRDTDGRIHLVYELMLTNGLRVPVEVSSVAVRRAGRRGGRIERLSGLRLEAAMSLLASADEPTTTVPGSAVGVVWFDVVLRRGARLPRAIRHTITVSVPPELPLPTRITSRGGFARVEQRPPTVVGPPLRGPGWIALGSCCDGPHRRALSPVNGRLMLGQRFAIDWNGFDGQRRLVVGDPDVNTNWVFFGKPVLAVADARVVAAVDRYPDQIPNNPGPVTLESAEGNHVILRLGRGRYVAYNHLRRGSIRVRRGRRVRRGQVIAELGNSGSSTGPHLHLQLMTRPSSLFADGLPLAFDRFELRGRTPPLTDALEETINAGQPIPVDTAGAGPRRRELPLGRDVVRFPGSF